MKKKKKFSEKVVQQLNYVVDGLKISNQELHNKWCDAQKEIGHWQNRLFQLQQQYDALRLANSTMLEPFKNLLQKEAALFIEANSTWVKRIEELEEKTNTIWVDQYENTKS